MYITAFWQGNSCTWKTQYLASIQHSVSLQNKCDLCSQKDGARKAINRRRQDMMFYYTTGSAWKLHSLCTHMPWMSNTYSIQMFLVINVQCSRLKSYFSSCGMSLVDCGPLTTIAGVMLVQSHWSLVCSVPLVSLKAALVQICSRVGVKLSLLWLFASCVQIQTLQDLQFSVCSKREGLKHPNLRSSSLLITTAAFLTSHSCHEVETDTSKLLWFRVAAFYLLNSVAKPISLIFSWPSFSYYFAKKGTFKLESVT